MELAWIVYPWYRRPNAALGNQMIDSAPRFLTVLTKPPLSSVDKHPSSSQVESPSPASMHRIMTQWYYNKTTMLPLKQDLVIASAEFSVGPVAKPLFGLR